MRASLLVALGIAALAAAPAQADTVKLKNGDTLTGTIVSIVDGKVNLKTAAAGDVTVDLAQVDTMATDGVVTIKIKDGTQVQTLQARLVLGGAGQVTTEATPVLAAQTIDLANLASVNEPPPPQGWTGTIIAAATITRGNSYTQRAALDINTVRRSEIDRITFDAFYRASRDKDESTGVKSTSERRVGGSLKYDYFFDGTKAYGYAHASGEKDAIADLDLRFIAGVGAGYQFVETETTKFNLEGGLSYFNENYSNATESVDEVAARGAWHFEHKFPHDFSVFQDSEVYKVLAGPRDYLVKTRTGVRDNFTENFFAQAWVEFDWDPTPAIGAKRTDVTYFFGLGWTF